MSVRVFGDLPGYAAGSFFNNRRELSYAGVHRPTQVGISGSQQEGADSIVISGGYEDDLDWDDVIIYTGHGGRDFESGKQVTHQELNRQNAALALNCQTGLPVRVIRGANIHSPHAPEVGYRYDGLYRVTDYWREKGRSGFNVWRFRLVRIESGSRLFQEDSSAYRTPLRTETTIQRIIRDTELARYVKQLYDHHCQVCTLQIRTNAGFYAEAAHIQPLGAPHHGPDSLANLLCLCPNHHAMFDFGGFSIDSDLTLLGLTGKLQKITRHSIDPAFLKYHREHFYRDRV